MPKGKILLSMYSSAFILASFSSFAEPIDISALKAEAISIVKQFGDTLKPQLTQALAQGGVKHAIEVCSVKAPGIAQQLSLSSQWQVKRVKC